MILKLGGKINILSGNIFLLVDHLWTRLLLVQTWPTENFTNWYDSCWGKIPEPTPHT